MPKVSLYVGQPCPTCGIPAILGKDGQSGYCKPCYVKWVEGKKRLTVGEQNPEKPTPPRNFDEEARGKVRHNFWLETFKYQLSKGQFDEAIANKTISGVIGVYVEKVMGEGKGATAQEVYPDKTNEDFFKL